MVSSMWLSNVSPGSSTAAIPPCAHAVEPDEMLDFASTTTFSLGARVSAAVSPAAPEPMMMTSASTSAIRSEEHTSELQSLMRISYAVFCLKKKNNKIKKTQRK